MENNTSEQKVLLELTIPQAKALGEALDVYFRLCLGQIDVVSDMVVDGRIPVFSCASFCTPSPKQGEQKTANAEQCQGARMHAQAIKGVLGFGYGQSMGINHKHLHISGVRAYEIHRVLTQAIAIHERLNPMVRGVNYNGLMLRYSDGSAPVASVITQEAV